MKAKTLTTFLILSINVYRNTSLDLNCSKKIIKFLFILFRFYFIQFMLKTSYMVFQNYKSAEVKKCIFYSNNFIDVTTRFQRL